MTPDPRPEVVDLLERLIGEFVETGTRPPEWDTRAGWATGDERTLAMTRAAGGFRAEFACYQAAADRQDAELAHREALLSGDVPADDKFLRDTGISS